MTQISESLKLTLPFLKILSKLSKTNRLNILKEIGGDQHLFNALHEIAHNTLNRRVKLDKAQIKKLKPYKRILEELCDQNSRKCGKRRKKLVQQGSGFLPILIPAIVSVLSSILSKND
jgi:hypothetical protein